MLVKFVPILCAHPSFLSLTSLQLGAVYRRYFYSKWERRGLVIFITSGSVVLTIRGVMGEPQP
jgi:hypothetical protein